METRCYVMERAKLQSITQAFFITFVKAKYIKTIPTNTFNNLITNVETKICVMLPTKEITDKNSNVAKIAPIANKCTSLRFNFSSEIFVENTPVQNKIVSGFDAVNRNPFINELLDFCPANKLISGIMFKPKTPEIILVPKYATISAPKILNTF